MTDIARRFGVSSNHLTLVLGGSRKTSSHLAVSIADFIGIPVDAFGSWAVPVSGHPPRRRRIQIETSAGEFAILAPPGATLADRRRLCERVLQQVAEDRRRAP